MLDPISNPKRLSQKPRVKAQKKKRHGPREQGNTTKITPARANYIRNNMDKSVAELHKETGLNEAEIELIILAKENDFYKENNYRKRKIGKTSKLDKMSDEMRDYLANMDKDSMTYKEMKAKFNRRWNQSDLTPIGEVTLNRYYKKLQKLGKT